MLLFWNDDDSSTFPSIRIRSLGQQQNTDARISWNNVVFTENILETGLWAGPKCQFLSSSGSSLFVSCEQSDSPQQECTMLRKSDNYLPVLREEKNVDVDLKTKDRDESIVRFQIHVVLLCNNVSDWAEMKNRLKLGYCLG